jgi:hypothetical protein
MRMSTRSELMSGVTPSVDPYRSARRPSMGDVDGQLSPGSIACVGGGKPSPRGTIADRGRAAEVTTDLAQLSVPGFARPIQSR